MRAVNGRETPVLVVSLPFAYRDGRDKYDGIMRYVREARLDCTLRIIRDTLNVEQFRQSLSSSVVGAICGTVGCFDGSRHDAALLTECLCLCQRRKIPLVGLDWPSRVPQPWHQGGREAGVSVRGRVAASVPRTNARGLAGKIRPVTRLE